MSYPHEANSGSVEPNSPATAPLKPEWLKVPEVTQVFRIGRSKLYELIKEQKIKTTFIKAGRGSEYGTRLVSYDSVAAYVEAGVESAPPKLVKRPRDEKGRLVKLAKARRATTK